MTEKSEFKLKASGDTNIGCVRATNQDSFLVAEDQRLFIVADGMGGHAGGEIASKLCVEQVASYYEKFEKEVSDKDNNEQLILKKLVQAVNHASTKIYEKALENPNLRGMGTTATVCKIYKNKALISHVGDSRCYLVRSGFLYQITADHSLVSEQVQAGIITPEEAETHHLRNVITRSVGYQEEEDVDTREISLEKSDLLLLCSDGLHGLVSDNEISKIASREKCGAVPKLIDLALERGGTDNVSVVIIEVE